MKHAIGSKGVVEQIRGYIDVGYGRPSKGVHIGRGRHVDMPDEYYEGAPGWTAHQFPIIKHPSNPSKYATPCDLNAPGMAAALIHAGDKLPPQALAVLQAKLASAEELTPDWEGAVQVLQATLSSAEKKVG